MNSTKITYIGHSTVLIESDGGTVLTDPNFSPNILLAKRKCELKYDPTKLPELTAVLISHTHLDHLDLASFNYINTTIPIICPEGTGKIVNKFLPNPVIELSHWADHSFSDHLKISAMPVDHSSTAFVPHFSKNSCSFLIEIGTKRIFFGGDSAYNTHFHDIGNTYDIDVAMLPIGAYKPSFFMRRYHMDPVEAVQAFTDLKAKTMIPIHWGTFRLSLEKINEPIEWLKKVVEEHKIADRVKILEHGENWSLP